MEQTDNTPDYAACLSRASMLMSRNRYDEAAEWYQQAISLEPDDSYAYAMLALCQMNMPKKNKEAAQTAKRAVELEPEDSFVHGVRAIVLNNTAKDGQTAVVREALAEAQEAARLDPYSTLGHTAMASACLTLEKWADAEAAALKALELDPDDTHAAELLSVALMRQGKSDDHSHLVRSQLEKNPEEDSTHSAAGWNALRTGDHKKANEHFAEALRLNPMSEGARLGLVESFRARSWVYRTISKFDVFVTKITGGRETLFWIGGYVVYRIAYTQLKTVAPWAAYLLAGCWLLFIFWSSMARGIASFSMLFDNFARRSLTQLEKWEGIIVGTMTLLAVAALVVGLTIHPSYVILAAGFFLCTIPATMAFTNDHYIGKWFYWAVTGFCLLCAWYPLVSIFTRIIFGTSLPHSGQVLSAGIGAAIIFSFLGMFRIGYR
jgi:tetratricopeptide (TPR) repeat protein